MLCSPLASHSPGWNSHSAPPCPPPTPRSNTSSRSSILCPCNSPSSDCHSSCTVPRSSSTASRCSSLPHSTHSSSTPPAHSPPSPSDSSALVVSPAAASHLPDWNSPSLPPCSPPTPRSNTSSRSSTPCPCNSPSSDSQSSCTVPRSSSLASRCSSLPHSTHSSSTPLAHSPPSPLGSSALGVSPAAASHSPGWSWHSVPPCSPLTPRSNTSSRSSTPCPCNSPSSDCQSSCTLPRSSSTALRCNSSLHSTLSSSTPPAHSPPSPSDSSALVVSPAAASHLPDWNSHSLPPCSPPTPRSNTSSRSSTPCPCNSPSSDSQSSCTLPRSSSLALRCSSLPHSPHSSSPPLAHSPPSPLGSSALGVSPAAASHSPGWSWHSVPPCSPPTPRSNTSARSSTPGPRHSP